MASYASCSGRDMQRSEWSGTERVGERARTTSGGERSRNVLMRGRERVRDVLEPHLGETHALERANNIAQALALEEEQPDNVAFEMLRELPVDLRRRIAAAVRRAWLAVEYDEFLKQARLGR
jgi:hypothetical protein